MPFRRAILVILLAGCLSGCTWIKSMWPWRKEVPVTPPSQTSSINPGDEAQGSESIGPAVQPATQKTTVSDARDESRVGRPDAPPLREVEIGGESLEGYASTPIDHPTPLVDLVTQPETRPSEPPRPAATTPEPPRLAETPPSAEHRPEEGPSPEKAVGQVEIVAASGIQVNEQVITIDEILRKVAGELAALPGNLSEQEFRERATQIIATRIREQRDELLVFGEAEKRLTDQQKNMINAQVDQIERGMIAEAGGSPTKLREELVRQGTTLQEVLASHRRRLTVGVYLRTMFTPAISVSRRKLLQYYQEHRSEFAKPKKVQMQLIAAPLREFYPDQTTLPSRAQRLSAKEKAAEVIQKAQKALREGREFGEVAKEFSRGVKGQGGGIWPPMPAGSFRETKVEEAAFKLDEGQVSDIIETKTGYYIVKAKKILAGEELPFEEAQKTIDEILREEQFRKLSEEYFGRIQSRSTVVYSERLLETAVDRAVQRFWRP